MDFRVPELAQVAARLAQSSRDEDLGRVTRLVEQARILAKTPPQDFERAAREFAALAANEEVFDSDLGALALEEAAEGLESDALRQGRLYQEALKRAQQFASWAASAAEGLARHQDVKRLARKVAMLKIRPR